MKGDRKLKGFYLTMACGLIVILGALVTGVKLEGSDVVAILALQASVGGAFFGANFGEHWAAAKKSDSAVK